MKRNASDKISRDKADKLIYEYLNNYIMYELYYSYRSTLEKCEFQELYQSLWVEVLADLPRFNPDLGRATTFFRYSIKHAVCIFVSFKKYNTTPYLANQLEKIKKIQQECEESGTPFTVELASKYLHCTIPTVLNYQVSLLTKFRKQRLKDENILDLLINKSVELVMLLDYQTCNFKEQYQYLQSI